MLHTCRSSDSRARWLTDSEHSSVYPGASPHSCHPHRMVSDPGYFCGADPDANPAIARLNEPQRQHRLPIAFGQ